MTEIVLEDVSKGYAQRDDSYLDVLDDLSFQTSSNDFVCVIGPSGCGKSTMMNLIAGLEDPSEGKVRVGDDTGTANIGFVFQEPRLLDWRTVRENLELALQGKGVPKSEWDERVDRYLDLVELVGFEDEYPRSLSGGMKQRVAIARAMAIDPDVILMDEPFSNLDEITARQLRSDLVEIWQTEPKTIVFVTHNALEAAYLGSRVLALSQRPASLVADREVTIERPRDLSDPELVSLSEELVDALEVGW
ncbi:ABC transporter ATP-binding protein [Halobacterium sp. R2-5]|uniref:ABC transporter ATP-binding protein n=1 Tax=Halobacterium sp. R2-5 TaxID=2715751 RepID=UPI00141EBAF7|nr:ABC transporter ATP-binding protein [Halobacterium sp. R2-5]NIC00958.1 ABC transporter ATP-binding protein [Halobacterium sp. R2-5]